MSCVAYKHLVFLTVVMLMGRSGQFHWIEFHISAPGTCSQNYLSNIICNQHIWTMKSKMLQYENLIFFQKEMYGPPTEANDGKNYPKL